MEEPRALPTDSVAIALAAADRRMQEMGDRLTFATAEQRVFFEARFFSAETALVAAKEALDAKLASGDSQLLNHIEAQKVSVDAALTALKELLAEHNLRIEQRFDGMQEALGKAEGGTEMRFKSFNEFRLQAADRDAQRVDAKVFDAEIDKLGVLIDRNRDDIADSRGKHVTVEAHETIVKEWTGWRASVDKRVIELSGGYISRATMDDLMRPMAEKVDALQRWQFKIAGALVLISIVLPGIVAFAVYLLTRTAVPLDGLE